jgi:triphosphoribosyl-dephospho-CoA synthetase
VIKDTIKHSRLVSTALYYSQVLKHLLYLMTNYYLIIFVILLADAEAADKAQLDAQLLLEQGAVATDVRPAEPTE